MAQIIDGSGIANAFSNFGTAIFGDPTASANAKYRNDMLALQRQKLSMDEGEMVMKAPLYDAQRQAAIASAANSNASAQQTADQNRASSELANVFTSGFVVNPDGSTSFDPQKFGQAAGYAAQANPKGDVAKILGGFMALSRQQLPNATEQDHRTAAAMMGNMPTTETAFTTGQVNRNIYAKPVVVSEGGRAVFHPNDPKNPDYVPPAPQAGGQPIDFNTPPAEVPASMLADTVAAPTATPQASPAPVQNRERNTIYNPKTQTFGTNSQNFKTFQEFQKDASTTLTLADRAAGLNNQNLLKNSQVPALASWSNPTAKIYDWFSQIGGGDGAKARLAMRDFYINDWLKKSEQLKGAITEKESSQLRAAQPNESASEDVKSNFLTNIEYYSRMEARWSEDNAAALQNGQKQPLPSEWKANYLKNNPPPSLPASIGKQISNQPANSKSTPLPDMVASGAAAPSAIDADVQQAMEIVRQYPGEKDRVNEMLIRAGKPPIK
jgi:hypothetical protein